jgi:DNA-binding CsgD family transcriptional regulator
MRTLSIARGTLYQHLARIRNAVGGHSYIETLNLLHQQSGGNTSMIKLTPRGKEVFQLLVEGVSNKKVGERLGMSLSGVKRHREKMLLNNDCASMLELIAKYHARRDPEQGNA